MSRRLTAYEQALLRAVIALGGSCHGVTIRQAIEASTRRSRAIGVHVWIWSRS